MKRAKQTIVILSLALAGCRGSITPASPTPSVTSLRLLSEQSTAPLLRDLTAVYRPEQTLVAWNVQTGDLRTLTEWLHKEDAPFALTNYLPPDSTLWSTPIGQDGLAVIVNPANPVGNLAPDQLRGIYTGRVLNWKEVGGIDLPIQVVSRPVGSSDALWFQDMVLGERHVTGAAQLTTTSRAMLNAIQHTPGAIGYASMSYLDASVRAVPLDQILPTPQTVGSGQYPLRSPLLFIGLHAPAVATGDDAYRAFFAWVQSPAGQAIVGKTYGTLKLSG